MIDRELSWYRYFVHNETYLGSFITLLHLPFMLMFLSLVLIGTWTQPLDLAKLLWCGLMVFFMVYGEHCLDELTKVGKPWETCFTDYQLYNVAVWCYILALCCSVFLLSWWAILGCIIGSSISICYALEIDINHFHCHSISFGAIGMGGVSFFTYIVTGGTNSLFAGGLLILGFLLGYLVNGTYRMTKQIGGLSNIITMWHSLGFIFVMIYSLAILVILSH